MSLAEKSKITAEDYLEGEMLSEVKHEFLGGEVWATVGASDPHVTIALNLAVLLKQKLKHAPCRTYISDMKVQVQNADAFFYPDVVVTCAPEDRKNMHYKEHPVFIAEGLSPSTEAFDRGEKFRRYRRLDSLEIYWLIDSGKQSIDSFSRLKNGEWLLHSYTETDTETAIAALDIRLPMAGIYEDVVGDND